MRAQIAEHALASGFDAVGFASAQVPWDAGSRLEEFLAQGFHGDMGWLAANSDRRAHPSALWPQAKSAIVLALNYTPEENPVTIAADRDCGRISVYAGGADYHDIIKKRLKSVGRWLAQTAGCEVKVFVDTAPLMEKPLAARAGLGWQGKHTNLVSRELGSWFFLGTILTDLELAPDQAEMDHCGRCRACLDICPTQAFPQPYRLDARRCISYLTIEHKGQIDREFRRAIGQRIYGCDDCLAVCPWNKFAQTTTEPGFAPRGPLGLEEFLRLDDAQFRRRFAGSPVKRTGRDRFVRNVLIAAGNSGNSALVPAVRALLSDPSALVRGMAVWAMRELAPQLAQSLRANFLAAEADMDVRSEWDGLDWRKDGLQGVGERPLSGV